VAQFHFEDWLRAGFRALLRSAPCVHIRLWLLAIVELLYSHGQAYVSKHPSRVKSSQTHQFESLVRAVRCVTDANYVSLSGAMGSHEHTRFADRGKGYGDVFALQQCRPHQPNTSLRISQPSRHASIGKLGYSSAGIMAGVTSAHQYATIPTSVFIRHLERPPV